MTPEVAAVPVDLTSPIPFEPQASTALTTVTGLVKTSFGDKGAASRDRIPVYKGKAGQTHRISIVDPDILFVRWTHSHFDEKNKDKSLGYINCRSTYERQGDMEMLVGTPAGCCLALGDARKRCGTLVMEYLADEKTGRPNTPLGYTLLVWAFAPARLEELQAFVEEGYDLAKTDFLVTCEDDVYQKLKFVPTKNSVREHPDFQLHVASVDTWKTMMAPKLEKQIGRDMTDQEIHQKLGGTTADARPLVSVKAQSTPGDIADLFG